MKIRKDKLHPVILLGGGPIALSVARALGKNNISCYVIDEDDSIVHHSRFCIGIKHLQDEEKVTWLEWLIEQGPKLPQKFVLMPCCDYGLKIVIENRKALEEFYILPEGNDEITLKMLDKYETYKLAKSLDIPIPEVWNVENISDLEKIADVIQYPCALKPRISHEFSYRFHGTKMFKVKNEAELYKYYHITQQYNLKMLITELIPLGSEGYDGYYTHIDENGNPLFHFTKLRLRQQPNLYGLGTYNVTNWNPEVIKLGLKFLQGIKLRGIGTLEFMRDARDGKLKLLECNPRFTGTTELLHKSGLNWALFVYNRLVGLTTPKMDYYKRGVYIIKPLPDYLAFRELKKNNKLSFIGWIKSLMHTPHFYIWSWSDPKPFIVNTYCFWKRQLLKLFRIITLKNFLKYKPTETKNVS
ncbi:MAG: ATP-grasp enzyme-like protein [Ignavibacteriae bacterium]|nr:MAG: ATP-grasp enzyme-like protein [Ignavibacteriota bacterium]